MSRARKTRWFHYSQNNSGGNFDFDEKRGLTHHVVIEARDAAHANERAESLGLYWDGCDSGRDCSCCGDRWSAKGRYGDDKGDPKPMIYGEDAMKATVWRNWMDDGYEIAIHPLRGKFKFYGAKEKQP